MGISLAGCVTTSQQRVRRKPGERPLRANTAGPPAAAQVDTWLAIHDDNTATLYLGFAELGQGATTALLQVAAEELDLSAWTRSAPHRSTRIVSPNQGGTYSSASIQRGRPQIAARGRRMHARPCWRGPPYGSKHRRRQLVVERGRVSVAGTPRRAVTFGELIGGETFELAITGKAPLKTSADYRLVAQPVPRADLAGKLTGTHTYIQHLRLPGMLHGRLVRPRDRIAYGSGRA